MKKSVQSKSKEGSDMYLIHEATVRHSDGVIDISIIVVCPGKLERKRYTYHLSSEKAARTFHSLLKRKSTHGRALAVLNKFKIK